jgi:branched-chain amino acid transport system permease protein
VIGLVLSLILSRLRSLYLAMATLAFIFIVKLIAESLPITGGTIGLIGIPRVMTTWHLLIIVAIVSVGMWMLSRGRIARITEAMRIDEVLVGTAGMSVLRQRHIVFVLSSILGALAGGLQALTFIVIIPDQVGFDLMLTALTILVIGGSRHWYGVIIGAVVVAWLPTWLAVFGYWRPVADGVVVVLLAVFASNGITGVFDLLVKRIHKRRRPDDGAAVDTSDAADGAAAETTAEVAR